MKLSLHRWFVSLLFVLILTGLVGCASLSEPRYDERSFEISAPIDLVWEGAISYFTSRHIPISKLEKDRGVIYAERRIQSSIRDDKYADCPTGHILQSRLSKMNVLVTTLGSDVTNVTINLKFQRAYTSSNVSVEILGTEFYDCESTGVGEREIYKEILEYVAQRIAQPLLANTRDDRLDSK